MLRGALAQSVQMAGALTSLLDFTMNYAKERQQFGRSTSRFQVVQQLVARQTGEARVAVISAREAVDAVGAGDGNFEVVATALRISQSSQKATAHEIHGAIGMTREYPLHRLTS